jgi:hypothetical protein
MSEDAKFFTGLGIAIFFIALAMFFGITSADEETIKPLKNNCLFYEKVNNHTFSPDTVHNGIYCEMQ